MPKTLFLIGVIILTGCASTPKEPAEICLTLNPDPNMLALSGPISSTQGVKAGSLRTEVTGERCVLSAAVYIDSGALISELARQQNITASEAEQLLQRDEFHDHLVDVATESGQQFVDRYPSGTVRVRYQYLPTKPIRPFTVTAEN